MSGLFSPSLPPVPLTQFSGIQTFIYLFTYFLFPPGITSEGSKAGTGNTSSWRDPKSSFMTAKPEKVAAQLRGDCECTWPVQACRRGHEGSGFGFCWFVLFCVCFWTASRAFYAFPFLKSENQVTFLKVIGAILTSIGLPPEGPAGCCPEDSTC